MKTIAVLTCLGMFGVVGAMAAEPADHAKKISKGLVYSLKLREVALPPGDGNPIDRLLKPYLTRNGLTLSPIISDQQFVRRASLDLIGLPATPQQIAEFQQDKVDFRRSRWVDRLLADHGNYAAHWMTFWSDLLRIESEVNSGTFDNDNTKAPQEWLKAQLDQAVPYDRFVRELIAGDFYDKFVLSVAPPGDFLSVVERGEMQMATMSSQVFLGIQMKCASCHDSFIDRWTLKDAWGLAVALGAEPLEIHRCQMGTGESAKPSFPLRELGEIDGQAKPQLRRARVAELMTDVRNGLFARTIVNRLWARLMGHGLVEPLDEMIEHDPWNAELLDYLAGELVRQQYDLKQLLRLIVTSIAYQSACIVRTEPLKDQNYTFTGPEMRRLTAEQFIDSVSLLKAVAEGNPTDRIGQRAWQQKSSRLMTMLGRPTRDVVVSSRTEEFSALLALELINGPELQQLVDQTAMALLSGERPTTTLVDEAYQVLLARKPSDKELAVAERMLEAPERREAVADLIWTIVMLPEFQLVP